MSGLFAMPAVLVAHEIGLFPLLDEAALPLPELCRRLRLEPRPAEALLAMCASQGLVRRDGEAYALLPLAQAFFVPGSPNYVGDYWEMLIRRHPLYSFDSLRQAILTDTPSYPRLFGGDPHSEQEADWTRVFTRAMHARGEAPARAWPGRVELSGHAVLLDVGGGSGVHAIAAVRHWPRLRAIVLDRAPVCRVAEEYLAASGVEGRVQTHVGDFWADEPFPAADLHFYSEVFHNHSLEQCHGLAHRSFAELPPGGRLLIHEMLLDDDQTGPAPVAAASLNMLLWSTAGRQHTQRELTVLLSTVGFEGIRTLPTCGYFSLTEACKPGARG